MVAFMRFLDIIGVEGNKKADVLPKLGYQKKTSFVPNRIAECQKRQQDSNEQEV